MKDYKFHQILDQQNNKKAVLVEIYKGDPNYDVYFNQMKSIIGGKKRRALSPPPKLTFLAFKEDSGFGKYIDYLKHRKDPDPEPKNLFPNLNVERTCAFSPKSNVTFGLEPANQGKF